MRFKLRVILSIILCLILTNFVFSSQKKLEAIRAAIKAKGAQWTAGKTWLSQLSDEEFSKLLGEKTWEYKIVQPPISNPIVTSFPPAIDWRNKDGHDWVKATKNQGSSGCCVSFASIATLESLVRIERNRPNMDIDLSEMHICNCCDHFNSHACSYLKDYGAPDEVCWPFEPVNSPCSNTCSDWQNRAVKINSYKRIEGINACKTCVAIAPILASFNVYEDYKSYSGGIYEHVWGAYVGRHSVCIVGYGTDTTGEIPIHYWIVKDSWPCAAAGAQLPDSIVKDSWRNECGVKYLGFVKFKMDQCGIETRGCYSMSGSVVPLPAVPINLKANAVSSSKIKITWTDKSNNEQGFKIQWKKANSSWHADIKVGAGVTSWTHTGRQPKTKYCYRVKAYNLYGDSNWSNIDCATTPGQPPAAPTNLKANAISSSKIKITWTDKSNNEQGFEIKWKKDGFSWHNVTVGAGVTSWTHTGLPPTTKYYYKVRAYNSYGNSYWSNIDWAITKGSGGQPPAAPSNLRATAPECFKIKLTWKDNSNNEQGFKIYRKSGSNWYRIATVARDVTKFWDTELPCGQTFSYKVRAYNAVGNSSYSNIASAKTMASYYCE